jgi:hypothetical protein
MKINNKMRNYYYLLFFALFFSCRAIKPYKIALPSGKIAQSKVHSGSGEFFIRSEIWDSTFFDKYELNCRPNAYFAFSKERIGRIANFNNQSFIAVTDSLNGEFYQFGKKITDAWNVKLKKDFMVISADEKALFQFLSKRSISRCPEYSPVSVIGFVVNEMEL